MIILQLKLDLTNFKHVDSKIDIMISVFLEYLSIL